MLTSKRIISILISILAITIAITFITVNLENRDYFCASCHTQPETEYYARSIVPATDLASAHSQSSLQVRCIDCHSGIGVGGRIISLSQGFADLMTYLTGNYPQPSITNHPIGDTACTKCHLPVSPRSDNLSIDFIFSNSHFHLKSYLEEWNARSNNLSGTCIICHSSHTISIDAEESFTKITSTNIACDQCHRALSGWVPVD